ncbi:glutamine amidotransferase [Ruegeria atlantica]|uniref:glutamine--fructose-6-phosphate transaminase (isomerizing) n=1 Tax=Ruegeria atlantica TaxID=81569 RepID=A0ABX1W9M2_9RHOB|nr:glutamine amidotransferase [Ruegeria atlantica]NOD29978.1 glutamine amidotransferase [Ruegeria atlantica]
MCGIAGRILTAPGQVGADLVDLMDAQEHRGADSTGFAVYGPPRDTGYVLRAMGFDKSRQDADLNAFEAVLKDHSSGFLSDPKIVTDENRHYCFRAEISDPTDLQAWVRDADELTDRFEVQSCGRSLEIIKDIGGAEAVAEKHGVRDIIGTHGLGHARLATESSVLPNASHPFWARPFSDVAIVHNGQITDYFTWRDKLSRKGYRFLTENDSELIAVWVSDQMKAGLTMEQALKKSITSIDGVFTYMIATPDGIGFAKDRFAMKPLVVVNRNGDLAAATEEQAVRRVMTEECDVINYDGPSLTGIWGVGNRSLAA